MVIDAIAFTFQTGSQRVRLPERYGNWRGVCHRLRMWAAFGPTTCQIHRVAAHVQLGGGADAVAAAAGIPGAALAALPHERRAHADTTTASGLDHLRAPLRTARSKPALHAVWLGVANEFVRALAEILAAREEVPPESLAVSIRAATLGGAVFTAVHRRRTPGPERPADRQRAAHGFHPARGRSRRRCG